MTQEEEYTRPATWNDVIQVVNLLNQHNVDFFLVGGFALAAHQLVRNTIDIDIAVSPAVDNSEKWIFALSQLPEGATKELFGEKDPFDGDYLHAIRINDEFTIDIMPSVAGVQFDELKKNVQIKEIQGVKIPVLDLYGLLQTKQTVRPKDQADAKLIAHAINELSIKNISQEENAVINSAVRYLSELSKYVNPRIVSKSLQKELIDSSNNYIKKYGVKAFSELLKTNFGQESMKLQKAIQLEQDRGM